MRHFHDSGRLAPGASNVSDLRRCYNGGSGTSEARQGSERLTSRLAVTGQQALRAKSQQTTEILAASAPNTNDEPGAGGRMGKLEQLEQVYGQGQKRNELSTLPQTGLQTFQSMHS